MSLSKYVTVAQSASKYKIAAGIQQEVVGARSSEATQCQFKARIAVAFPRTQWV